MKRKIEYIIIPLVFLFGYLAVQLYKAPALSVSTEAPDFTAYLSPSDSFRLSDSDGTIRILHFWGSWCGPCRSHNKELVDAYQKFGSTKEMSIISIGIETKEKPWLRAREQDKLDWPLHVTSFQRFNDPIARLYGVREIPTIYVLGPDRKILLVNPNPVELDQLLSKQTGQLQ
jgi:thiol-disulfide isomerase/thioredoxin